MYPSAKFSARPPSPQFANFSPPSDYPSAVSTSHHQSTSMRHSKSTSKAALMMSSDGDNVNSARMLPSNTLSGRGDLIFPDDIESIEFCLPPSNEMVRSSTTACHGGDSFPERRRKGHSRRSNQKVDVEKQVKWSRKNIAATMERFEPNQPLEYGLTAGVVAPSNGPSSMGKSTLTPLHQALPSTSPQLQVQQDQRDTPINHVYSYAYYEPGAAKCHTNIPHKDRLSPIPPLPGTSKSPPRNSIRALLAKSFRSKTLQGPSSASSAEERHTYTTRYGTTENLYEEVNDQKIRKVLSDNRIGPANVGALKEEFRRVQHNHFRVLDELNLSLEALIMPPTPPDISPTQEEKQPVTVPHGSLENLSSTLNSIELKDHTCINPEFDEGDLDSGFSGSGSSSGASYNESLRYYKTGTQSVMHTTTLPHNLRSCRSSTASGTSTSKSSMNSSEDQGIGMLTSSSSPFNYNRRCSETQRSSARSASTSTGTKPKKNFWTIKP